MSGNGKTKPFWAMFQKSATKNSPKVKMEPRTSGQFGFVKNEIKEEESDSFKEFEKKPNKKRKKIVIKNDEYDKMMMVGVEVRLPVGLKPYPTQKLMMVRIITAIKNQFNVLAESPTGSGKTMALLASTCAWLRTYQGERTQSREKCELHGDKMSVLVKNEVGEIGEDEENEQKGDGVDIKNSTLFENQWVNDFIPYSPNKKDSKDSTSIKTEPEQPAKEEIVCTCLPRVRIYYGTRTHKQISQVVKEFGRLPYAKIIKHTILASREQSCVNPAARKSQDIAQYCKEINGADGIGCSFKTAMRNRFEKAGPLRAHLEFNGSVVFDTEEVVETLATSSPQLCPYFCTTRVLTQDADLVFCPFSYLVDPIIRNSSDVHVKNSIVILDEAHNIEDTCRDAASFSFTEKELDDSLMSFRTKRFTADNELENTSQASKEMLENIPDRIVHLKEMRASLLEMEHLTSEIIRWMKKTAKNAEPGKSGRDNTKTCTLSAANLFDSLTDVESGIDLYTPQNTPRHAKILSHYNAVCAHNEPDMAYFDIFKPSATAIVCIEKWMYFQSYFGQPQYQTTYRLNVLIEPIQQMYGGNRANTTIEYRQKSGGVKNMRYTNDDEFSNDSTDVKSNWLDSNESTNDVWFENGRSSTGSTPIEPGCKTTISMWCMSPALSFIDAFNDTRSVILASGTLCPMDTLKTELGMEFRQQVEGDQVIEADRIFAACLPIGPHGSRIQCTYRNTADPDSPFYREVGSIIKYVCVNVPAGILCFLPSYRVLDQLKAQMERSAIMRQIEMKKRVLFEPRRSSELAGVMAEFDTAIFEPHKFGRSINGALMFAVFRGKVSEGIDFADDRARVVISVGIPFPNSMDDLVTAKRVYNDENSKKLGILNGEEWYITQAYRALNQALGRCLRHKNDWGAMLMIDERLERQCGTMTSGAASARVSKWIRAQLKSYPSFNKFNDEFRVFIEKRTSIDEKPRIEVKKEEIL